MLKTLNVWCADDDLLHVRLERGATHLASPSDRATPLGDPAAHGVALHRTLDPLRAGTLRAVDELEEALMQIIVCQPREHAVAALDSAVNQKLITRRRLDVVTRGLRTRHRDAVRLIDPKAQSGLETFARLRLRARGIGYRSQVFIPRVGKVDLVIGDRLVVELDGKKWHSTEEAFAEDRRRDLELHEQRYLPLRLTYAQVAFHWDRIETVIDNYVRSGEHRWAARHRRGVAAPR